MTSGFFSGDLLKGLAPRVLFFLSIALLPIGLIAIVQTREIARQTETGMDLSLIALTEKGATGSRSILQQAFGAADALSTISLLLQTDPERCAQFMRGYRQLNGFYSLVGFVDTEGQMACSSAERAFDLSGVETYQRMMENPRRMAVARERGAVTGERVTVVTNPVRIGGELQGFISISIPTSAFERLGRPSLSFEPITLLTLNRDQEILRATTDIREAAQEMPADVALSLFTDEENTVFRSDNIAGEPRIYASQTLVDGTVYALSVWSPDAPFLQPDIGARLGLLLPLLMWIASLIVAFWALNRLALRHIRKLGRQMRRFGLNRDLPRTALGPNVPSELREMESAFTRMGEGIIRDEAKLEDSLREKNILLKEVHHRVRNNLQLISSIMNMQIRQVKTEDSLRILHRMQERTLILAAVHRNLYQNDDLAQVNTARLVSEVVDQILTSGLPGGHSVELERQYDEIYLEADDAAPLTLLISEAMSNAIKYVPKGPGEGGHIRVSLIKESEVAARLVIENSIRGKVKPGNTVLGSKLIKAFARQLNGTTSVEEGTEYYRLTLHFPLPQDRRPQQDF